jgi:uncharacterized tellurite resistance protein B-like protein
MFGSMKNLLSYLAGDEGPRIKSDGYTRWLVTAALLTRAATVHREMSEARQKALYSVLRSSFGLDDRTMARLIEESAAINRNAIDLYHFTRQLNETLNDDGRHQIVRMMWEIAYADGDADEFDANVIWRAADLLGVSSRQRVELRQQVSAGRAAFARVGFGQAQSPASATAAIKCFAAPDQ